MFEVYFRDKKSGDGPTGMPKDEKRNGRIRGKMTSDEVSGNFSPSPFHLESWKRLLTVLGCEVDEPSGKPLRSHILVLLFSEAVFLRVGFAPRNYLPGFYYSLYPVYILLGPCSRAGHGMCGSWLLPLSTTHITGCPVCDDACTRLLSHCGLPRAPTLCCKNTSFWSAELVCPTTGVHKLFLPSLRSLLCAPRGLCTPVQVPSPWAVFLSFLGCPPLALC